MKSLRTLSCHVFWYSFFVCSLMGCKRDVPVDFPITEERNVVFKLSGFRTDILPIPQANISNAGFYAGGQFVVTNVVPSPDLQYLYYWSFNDENLEPDIAVDGDNATIEFAGNSSEPEFANGFPSESYEAGRALSIRGVEHVVIRFPLEGVSSLETFAFDVSSSNTGPKDFIISYSLDGGETYHVLGAENQFGNMGNQVRNPFAFGLEDVPQPIHSEWLSIKLEFLPGNREGAGDYNENTGVVRLDNIRLLGIYGGVGGGKPTEPETLHYYVFSQHDGSMVLNKALRIDELGDEGKLAIKLNEGIYSILFVAYRSNAEILLPSALSNVNEFYFGHHFDDHDAVTYAALIDHFEVSDVDTEKSVALKRCYSMVTLDFTDHPEDLAGVKKIEITRQHGNYWYTPFGEPTDLPISDTQTIHFEVPLNPTDYHLAFHQFLGLVDLALPVVYEVVAYGKDEEVLNVVTLEESIHNNVQLRFSGRLLGNLGSINGFGIEINTIWDDELEKEF